jgi:hypothetical protein
MKDISAFSKIYLARDPVDFRKQANGLLLLVKEKLELNVFDAKYLFVFTNKTRRAIRFLYWDLTGFAVWSKVLEKDKFHWLKNILETSALVTTKDLRLILQGADLSKINLHKPLDFEEIL